MKKYSFLILLMFFIPSFTFQQSESLFNYQNLRLSTFTLELPLCLYLGYKCGTKYIEEGFKPAYLIASSLLIPSLNIIKILKDKYSYLHNKKGLTSKIKLEKRIDKSTLSSDKPSELQLSILKKQNKLDKLNKKYTSFKNNYLDFSFHLLCSAAAGTISFVNAFLLGGAVASSKSYQK